MADRLAHRGPDDNGAWSDPAAGIGLGHRRLAIIDLTADGHQPMTSACGRYVIAYNGEIYNYPDIRAELVSLGHGFKGHSDTEVLVQAVVQWGVEAALKRANGMFAFALWDKKAGVLTLARDRMGQKPLYYGRVGGALVFASELKAIEAVPGFARELNPDVTALYMRHGYVPDPHCIWRGLFKLLPGTFLTLNEIALHGDLPAPKPYWRVQDAAAAGQGSPLSNPQDAVSMLETELTEAVQRCMVSDVPLGSFLSGGIDSSAVTALMQAASDRPVKTFSIGFDIEGYDEASHARAVAKHLGTDHTELYLTDADARAIIPSLPDLYDEPFSDPSMIPTHLVSRLAREHVTVALSGDGGDELFGGYNRYTWAANLRRAFAVLPQPMRQAAAHAVKAIPVTAWDRLGGALPQSLRRPLFGDKVHKLADVFDAASVRDAYWRLVSLWKHPDSLVIGGKEPLTVLSDPSQWQRDLGDTEHMMLMDALTYLPGDILTKVDRAAMGVSLETRVPLLDHRVVELAWRMPLDVKIRDGQGKWPLRQVLDRHVPKALIDRPKMGFGVPIDAWLRGDLRDWAEDLLSERRLREDGILNPEPVRAMWAAHLTGRRNWPYHLWTVLMFQAWMDRGRT